MYTIVTGLAERLGVMSAAQILFRRVVFEYSASHSVAATAVERIRRSLPAAAFGSGGLRHWQAAGLTALILRRRVLSGKIGDGDLGNSDAGMRLAESDATLARSHGLSPEAALALIETHRVGTWTWELASGSVTWSPGMSQILGVEHRPETQTLDAYEQLLHPEDRLDFDNPARTAGSGMLTDRLYRVVRPDGEMRWVRSLAKLIHNRDGRPERLMGVGFDVTETRLGLLALRQRDGLAMAIRDLFDVVVWMTDADGEVSDEVEWWRATGQKGRVDKWHRLDVVHPDDRDRVRAAWADAIDNRKRYSVSARVLWGGTYVPIVSRAVSILGSNGMVEGWIGFSTRTDATGRDVDQVGTEQPALTPGQVRAARGFLGWSAEQLADKAGVSFSTVRRVEAPTERGVREQSLAAIRKALERAGIVFAAGPDGRAGVSMKG